MNRNPSAVLQVKTLRLVQAAFLDIRPEPIERNNGCSIGSGTISSTEMMTELSTFHLYCANWQFGPKFTDYLVIVKAGWTVFRSSLRELRLDVPLQTLTEILSLSLQISRPESININIQRACVQSNIADMVDLLAPFINNPYPRVFQNNQDFL